MREPTFQGGDRVMVSARHLRALGTKTFAHGNAGLSTFCRGKGTVVGPAPKVASVLFVLWDEDEVNGIARGISAANLVHARDVAREADEAQHSMERSAAAYPCEGIGGKLRFSQDRRAQAAVLADLPESVAQEAGEFYENAGGGRMIKKREAMAEAWAGVLRPYLIGLRDWCPEQERPALPEDTSDGIASARPLGIGQREAGT